MKRLSRRHLLQAGLGSLVTLPFIGGATRPAAAHHAGRKLEVGTRILDVKGKAAKVFGLTLRENGAVQRDGLILDAGDRLHLTLSNACDEATLIHWHGLTPPNAQDGVPGITQPLLQPGESFDYDFPVALPGTNWMHSHFGLQEQRLMAAPLIVRDPAEAGLDEQEIVILLHDFTFRDPEEILAGLQKGMAHGTGGMDHAAMGHDMSQMPDMDMSQMDMGGMPMAGMDLNDVAYDAFLANDRTLDDPQVVRVEKGQRLRLRIINGAAGTNFMVDLGALEATLNDVDGRPIQPVSGSRFPLAIAQRADLRFALPAGAWPILFQREGDTALTGIVVATKDAQVAKIADRAAAPIGAIDRLLPMAYAAAQPLTARPADRRLSIALTGSMMTYRWGIADPSSAEPLFGIKAGERVELELVNQTEMSHPIHLHGHHFQIVERDGKRVAGAMRDTELVPAGGRVAIAFDAGNPGRWMFHCHNLYHMASGMMTEVAYL